MKQKEIERFINKNIPDEVINELIKGVTFSVPWQYDAGSAKTTDADGAPIASGGTPILNMSRAELQAECWTKFETNPQVNTAVRDEVGRLTGLGFESTSEIEEIQDVIEKIETDWRNRLYHFWPKYVARHKIEGELFLCLTCHMDGFVEVDFIKPGDVDDILWHPFKAVMPLFFNIKIKNQKGLIETHQIPSVFIARAPKEMVEIATEDILFDAASQTGSRSADSSFKKLGGYNRFIINLDRGLVTKRATGYLKTILTWLNKYEMLKNWEIDHKRSAGAYLWVITCEDPKKFKKWLAMSDEDKKKTGLTAAKTPGGTLFLPPGFKMEVKNPQLPNISDSDTDIIGMVISGLNANENSIMGVNKGTFASVKESRGPQSDRTADEIAYFSRFLINDFWGNIFFLMNKVIGFPNTFKRREAWSFKNGKPVFKYKRRRPEELVDLSFPVSESIDLSARSTALLGSKHGPLNETLGVPGSKLASLMGFGGYGRMRLRHATEKEQYPELIYSMNAESIQEKLEGEPKAPNKKVAEKEQKDDGDGGKE